MIKLHKDSRGFSVIEMVLIIVVVGMIGFVGWYVYRSMENTNNIYSSTTKISSTNSPKFTKINKIKKSSTNSNVSAVTTSPVTCSYVTVSDQKYMLIKQLNLEIPLNSTDSDLCYVWTNADSTDNSTYYANIVSAALYNYVVSQDPTCSITNKEEANGTIPDYYIGAVSEAPNTTSVSNANQEDLGAHIALSGNLYLFYTPQDGCTDVPSADNLIGNYESAFQTAFPKSQIGD